MARVTIVGGGLSGVVAAETLAKKLSSEHEITLVSRSRRFVFYPALVRLAFGRAQQNDITLDLRNALLDRRIEFVEGEVPRIYPYERQITVAGNDFVGDIPYDFLILALGRRLKTELIAGFFEHAHHLLGIREAQKFGQAASLFKEGKAVLGYCSDARLPVPMFEAAFALSHHLDERGVRNRCEITIVSSESLDSIFGVVGLTDPLSELLAQHQINLITDFSIDQITADSLVSTDGRSINFNLNMVIPPFGGSGALVGTGITDDDGYVQVDHNMRVRGFDRLYAIGDCVSFDGPKMGHMAVRQAEVAAENLAAEIEGRPVKAAYDHELMLVIDTGDDGSIFVDKDLWNDEPASINSSRFWAWAKRRQEQYWKLTHR
jgi:NADH dehydrogenase FAD-containing subunit